MPESRRSVTVGVDVGGTFTDVIVGDSGGLTVLKLPTTSDPSAAVLRGLRSLGANARRAVLISHATTLATNALLTRAGLARTALITNEGFRDVLEIGRQRRPELYSLESKRPIPLVERKDRLTIGCRIGADGSETRPLGKGEAEALALRVARSGYGSVAVCFLNSYANGVHEKRVRTALRESGFRGHISLSSEVDREYREYERTSTTVVNAALSPLMSGYLTSLSKALHRFGFDAPVCVMNSDGGASTIPYASSHPVAGIESGPAAGVVASKILARGLSLGKVMTFDMGGTTAKAGTVIGGEPEVTNEFEAAGKTHSGRSIKGSGYPVRGDFIDLAEVSAGGGTVAWVDEAGELKAGPKSAGSEPGPACYGLGGTEPTVTDANVVLGRLNPRFLLGGSMPVYRDRAVRAVRALARKLTTGPEETAVGILRLVNDSMAKAMSKVTVERGRDPSEFVMFAFGGGGPLQACDLAEEMGIREIVVPVHAGLFSAYGLLAGELTRTYISPIMQTGARLEGRFRELEASAAKEMRREGFRRLDFARFAECRYLGQSHELLIPFSGDSLRADFDGRHEELYGYSIPDAMEVVNIKVRATARKPVVAPLRSASSRGEADRTQRRAWLGGRRLRADVLTRESLDPGSMGRGPCIIEEYDSTLAVNPSWKWSVESYGTRLTR